MANARIRMPTKARAGEIIEIKALAFHTMESGFRVDNIGRIIPRHIIEHFVCTYGGEEVFRVRFHPAVATNPYVAFSVLVQGGGEFVFTWTDDRGGVLTERTRLDLA